MFKRTMRLFSHSRLNTYMYHSISFTLASLDTIIFIHSSFLISIDWNFNIERTRFVLLSKSITTFNWVGFSVDGIPFCNGIICFILNISFIELHIHERNRKWWASHLRSLNYADVWVQTIAIELQNVIFEICSKLNSLFI